MPTPKMAPGVALVKSPWLDSRGAATYCGIGYSSWRELQAAGRTPAVPQHLKVRAHVTGNGCRYTYHADDLDAWMCLGTPTVEDCAGLVERRRFGRAR